MGLDRGALRWVEECLGGRVTTVQRLVGGITAGMYRVGTADARSAVLRRWDGAATGDDTRNDGAGDDGTADDGAPADDTAAAVRREAAALRFLAGTAVPAPGLLAADPDGAAAGVPSLLMTLLPGEVLLAPTGLDDRLRALAATLVAVHATPVQPGAVAPFVPWTPRTVPGWAAGDPLWTRAFAVAHGPRDPGPPVLLHGDFQHFNVLWRDGRVCGVVDWPNAGTGSRGVDVGHCRLNLAVLYSAAAAERFREHYEDLAGCRVDPRADVAALCSYGPDWPGFLPRQVAGRAPVDRAGMRGRVEEVLRRALRGV